MAKNGELEGNSNKITSHDKNSEIYLEQTDSKTFSEDKNSQIDLSSETESLLLSHFAKDAQFLQKVRSIKSLAQTLNDSYSKDVVLFFENNQHLDLGSLKVV